ncbi:hypothetical protein [uncultured Duncaniella sp.]|uniref:hypothetical protein n=1 Tax=uncultured Duncaniella sp. TaxID=2768039 RepID=UPI00262C42FB|nr:hypothetical protein [uncultured Duncaniella sp.]
MSAHNFNWNASAFFEHLTATNRHAIAHGYTFARVSSLEGFHGALSDMLETPAFVAVSDTSQGYLSLDNSPHTRRTKLIFLAMRHAPDSMTHREECMDNMRELFRQFMSALLPEKTRLLENGLYLSPRIDFNEIDRYFFTGCACAFFQIAVDTYTDLSYNPDEWLPAPTTDN